MASSRLVAALYALICLIWGSTWLVIKVGLDGVPPFLGAGLRFALAAAVLGIVSAARGPARPLDRDDQISIWSSGLLSFTLSYACVYWAEQYISSGLTAILYCTMPLVVALLSRFWTRAETLSGRKVGGILIAMAGTAALFWPDGAVTRDQVLGMASALLSAVAAAVNLVMLKRHSRNTDIVRLNGRAMAIGAVGLFALSALLERHSAVTWTRANAAAVVYLSLVGSVAAFLSYTWLVKVMDATKLSLITLIFPLIAVGLGVAFLHETASPRTFGGMATVLAGVAVALVPARKRLVLADARKAEERLDAVK